MSEQLREYIMTVHETTKTTVTVRAADHREARRIVLKWGRNFSDCTAVTERSSPTFVALVVSYLKRKRN